MLRLFQRPGPVRTLAPLATATHCACRCHDAGYADRANVATVFDEPIPRPFTVNGIVSPGVARDDTLSAASACRCCLDYHTHALSGRPPELDRARYCPPPLVAVEPTAQADGGTVTDDGN